MRWITDFSWLRELFRVPELKIANEIKEQSPPAAMYLAGPPGKGEWHNGGRNKTEDSPEKALPILVLCHCFHHNGTHHLRANTLPKESQESRFLLPPFLDTLIIQRDQRMPVLGQHDPRYFLRFCESLAATDWTVTGSKSLLCVVLLLWPLSTDFFNLDSTSPPLTLIFFLLNPRQGKQYLISQSVFCRPSVSASTESFC